MSKIKSKHVTKKQVQELLKDSGWIENRELTERTLIKDSQVYIHHDGRVLDVIHLHPMGDGRLYPDLDEFMLVVKTIEETHAKGNQHVLAGRLPQGESFIEQVPALIDELARLLKLERAELDGSMESLLKVERKVKHLGRKKCIEPPIFPALVAYIGEVMRIKTHGRWEIRLDAYKHEIWEPWIVDSQGRVCNPWLDLFDMLYEPEPISIMGSTAVRITSRRIPPDPTRQGVTNITMKSDKQS